MTVASNSFGMLHFLTQNMSVLEFIISSDKSFQLSIVLTQKEFNLTDFNLGFINFLQCPHAKLAQVGYIKLFIICIFYHSS